MASTTPKRSQPELSIGVHRGSFQETLFRMNKLANKRVVQSGLPFLDESKFEAAKIGSACKKMDWGPDEQVLVFAPEAKGQFGLDQAVVGELVVLSSATVLTVEDMMKSRSNVEFGLKIGDVCKTQIHTIGKEKILGEKLVGFQR